LELVKFARIIRAVLPTTAIYGAGSRRWLKRLRALAAIIKLVAQERIGEQRRDSGFALARALPIKGALSRGKATGTFQVKPERQTGGHNPPDDPARAWPLC
jgi:hypothetical protein